MSLTDLLNNDICGDDAISDNIWSLLALQGGKKIGISHERLKPTIQVLREYIAYWREYPDMFIDFLQTGKNGKIPETGLRFYFYQRVWKKLPK